MPRKKATASDRKLIYGAYAVFIIVVGFFAYSYFTGGDNGPPNQGTLRVFASYDGSYMAVPIVVTGPATYQGTTTTDRAKPLTFQLAPGTYTVSGTYNNNPKSSTVTVTAGQTVDVSLNFGGPPPPPAGDLPLSWQRYEGNPLNIPKYTGQGVVHPDVMYFQMGKDGYKYWMIYTPYPGNNDENLCIVRSNDGISWTASGINNPVIPRNIGPWNADHNADPDWLYISEYNKWFVVWSVVPTAGRCNLAFTYSDDGKSWNFNVDWGRGNPVLIENAIEATMIFRDGRFHMLYCSPLGWLNMQVHYISFRWDNANNKITDIQQHGSWFAPATVDYQGGTGHIDLVQAGNDFYLIGPRILQNAKTGLFCWKATGSLGAFEDYGTLLSPSSSGFDSRYIYRSSLLQDEKGNLIKVDGKFMLYYSGYQSATPLIGLATASPD